MHRLPVPVALLRPARTQPARLPPHGHRLALDPGHHEPARHAVQHRQRHPRHLHLRPGRRLHHLHHRRPDQRICLPQEAAALLQEQHHHLSPHHVHRHGVAHRGQASGAPFLGRSHHRGYAYRCPDVVGSASRHLPLADL